MTPQVLISYVFTGGKIGKALMEAFSPEDPMKQVKLECVLMVSREH